MQTTEQPDSLFDTDKRYAFLLICLGTFLLLFIKKSFIENETAVFEFLQDRPEGTVLRLISALQFISIPLVYAWKFTVIGFVIWVGCFMFGYKVTYRQCWGVALVSEFVFFLPEILKIVWFLFVDTNPDFNSVKIFYPLSLINLVDYTEIDKRFIYPLKACNLFELLYWVVLVIGIHHYTKRAIKNAVIIVLGSYVPLFLAWLLFYMIVYN